VGGLAEENMIDECKQCKHSCWDYVEALGGHKRWYVDSCDLDRDPYDEEECEEFEEAKE
jgi:hypothetical protein